MPIMLDELYYDRFTTRPRFVYYIYYTYPFVRHVPLLRPSRGDKHVPLGSQPINV